MLDAILVPSVLMTTPLLVLISRKPPMTQISMSQGVMYMGLLALWVLTHSEFNLHLIVLMALYTVLVLHTMMLQTDR